MDRMAHTDAGQPPQPGQELELRALLAITHRLPRVTGAGRIAQSLTRLYLRKPRPCAEADILGFRMRLDPMEFLEQVLLFYPQFWDAPELAFVAQRLRPGDLFLDIGAHVGLYSLAAARRVGAGGRVLAVEAAPDTFRKLCFNLHLNALPQVQAMNCGIADRRQTLRLSLNTSGNLAANSFLFPSDSGVAVACVPLLELLREQGVQRVTGAKLDIEGYEHRVLLRFLADAEPELWPQFMIIERNPAWVAAAGGDPVALLLDHGYAIHAVHDENYMLVRAA